MKTYYPSRAQLAGATHRYSVHHAQKPVPFYLAAPDAQAVCIVGDFNAWTPGAHPLQRRQDGSWQVELQLSHGHHPYVFIVDGQPMLDPRANGVTRNRNGERVSMVSVS